MSQAYYIKRDRWGWKYKNRSFPYASWSFFTDKEKDLQTIKEFFHRSSDSVGISFTSDDLLPTNFFEVSRRGNKMEVVLNAGEKRFFISEDDLISLEDTEGFFLPHFGEEMIEKAKSLQPYERMKFYRDNASEDVLKEYREMVLQRMSEDSIRERLSRYDPQIKSEVFFISE